MNTLEIFFIVILSVVVVAAVVYVVLPATMFRLLIVAGRKAARLKPGSVIVGDVEWPFLEGGPPDGEVLLLVHGFGAEKDHWLPYARFFSKRFRVVIPDLPGFGESSRSLELDYGVDSQADRLDAFLDALGVSRCHVAGNSMGGYILLMLALRKPGRLLSMTLLNAAGVRGPNKSALDEAVERGENLLQIKSPEDLDRLLTLVMEKSPWIPARFKRVIADRAVADLDFLDLLFHQLARQLRASPLNDELAAIPVPTFVVWGRHDRLVDVSCVGVLEECILGCESVIFDDIGHMPMVEAPARSARYHLEFLDRLKSRAYDFIEIQQRRVKL